MSLLFEDLFKRLNSDLKRMADSVLSKVISKRMMRNEGMIRFQGH